MRYYLDNFLNREKKESEGFKLMRFPQTIKEFLALHNQKVNN